MPLMSRSRGISLPEIAYEIFGTFKIPIISIGIFGFSNRFDGDFWISWFFKISRDFHGR